MKRRKKKKTHDIQLPNDKLHGGRVLLAKLTVV